MRLAAIIVAAGRSSRFETGHKLLAEIADVPIVRYAAAAADASPVDDIVLVIAPDGQVISDAAGMGRWRTVINPQPENGLSSSIQAGLAAIEPAAYGVVIILADMPGVTSGLIAQLCTTFTDKGGANIVFPQTADGRQGNPVLWPRALLPELMALTGDTGGKPILAAHPELHAPVMIDSDAATFDIDTHADLANAISPKR